MKTHSKMPLFLMELILMLLVFAYSAVICLQVFAGAKRISEESRRLDYAVVQAQTAAEFWKVSHGDLQKTAEKMGASPTEKGFSVKENWFEMIFLTEGPIANIQILHDGEEFYSINCEAVIVSD